MVMLLISWNVAGWNTTVNRIHENYGTKSKTKSKLATPSSPIAEYFSRHGDPLIVCLQEHKIPHQQLTSRSEPRQAATIPGYESFWSCCVDPQRKGFNGAVTYVKTGSVLRADAAPLRDTSLDQQGRCVMTDHGKFVVFNVYVPNSGGQSGGPGMAMKMRFLKALRRSMQRERRENGKAVILVGDLNISHKAIDVCWKWRTVHIGLILDEVEAASASPTDLQAMPVWKRDVAKHWTTIEKILETRKVVQTKTSNSLTKEVYHKYRLCVTVDNRPVFLGKHQSSAESAMAWYDYQAEYYTDEETSEQVLARENRTLCLFQLVELMYKLVNIEWSEGVQREIAQSEVNAPRISPKRKWLTDVLEQDEMVDAFRHFFPHAQGRFTCWDQYTNCRYVNEGSRIDYTLIDKSLLPHLIKGADLQCCMSSPSLEKADRKAVVKPSTDKEEEILDPCSERMALRAATAGGSFQPVSFQGGGMSEASQEALDTQFGPPHTGLIYTPPTFSDHIGVSASFDDNLEPRNLVLQSDVATRKTQPHKVQRTIASFFGMTASSSDSSSAPHKTKLKATIVKAPVATKANRKQHFFAPVTNKTKSVSTTSQSSSCSKRRASSQQEQTVTAKQCKKNGRPTAKTTTILHHFQKQTK